MSIFEQASRLKLRFDSTKGQLATEDLWGLPLVSDRSESLNSIAKRVNKELKAEGEEDFVGTKTAKSATLNLKLDIVKHIISVRLAENEAKHAKAATETKKALLEEILAKKKNEALEGKSIEELEAELKALT